ncbi:prenyltransferase alpha subunit [Colletotrichum melonis]|uniref:Protein farnesyltransferase/geranylgeranyltransferase type-1 subunit alpha n=1 Tax=Colletotrichum melonis TaxID=1209925 RepID=A0AAI9U8B4_9PEZI|nr:prenyltransferase alpha subunit [Colletotrichum melonis]
MPAKSKVSSKAKEAESKSTLASAVFLVVGSYSSSLWTLIVAHYLWFRAFFLPHADLGSPNAGKQTPSSSAAATAQEPPKTVNERSLHRFYQTNPHERKREEAGGLHSLTPAERQAWVNASLVRRVASKEICLNNKAEREFWKQVNRESPPIRRLDRQKTTQAEKGSGIAAVYDWGKDKNGRDVGEYPLEQFAARAAKQAQLTALEILHRRFLQRREFASAGVTDAATGKIEEITKEDIQEETQRRREMSAIRKELYGDKMGPYATDPEWDDVMPIPAEEPEGALATIAYPEDYAEVMSYLRAVMVSEEYSPRCLRLTEHVISMNPAHYTVWLYRFKIVRALETPLADEIEWLNEVSLEHIKNYQIWHHRQLLLDHYYEGIKATPDEVKRFGRSETEFLTRMLEEDTKNYHVWSYRQYLVRKLGLWNMQELLSTQNWIEEDVRNNSAWSHRFFLVFSDPANSTEGSHATEHDPKVPADVVDREIRYAEEKTLLAPQNQAAWNYLRGVLVKGGRKLETAEAFAGQFVKNVGAEEDKEEVRSSHALDFLAEVLAEKGQKEEAAKYLDRLAAKWDPVRAGYWKYRKQQLGA